MQATTNFFSSKYLVYVYMVYMEVVYKFGRLYGHTRDKTIFLLVKNANKRKISFSDVKTGHMCYFFSEIFVVYFNHLDERSL